MPIARFEMPDGRIGRFEVPEGTTPEQAQQLIAQHLSGSYNPMQNLKPVEKPDTGFTGAFKSSLEGLKGEAALLAGKTGLMDEAAAEKYYKEKEEEAKKKFKPTEEGWTEAPWEKLKETLGGSLPYMAAPAAAALGVASLPITGPTATALGLGAAGLASATQFTGSNLARQMEAEGKSLKETDLLAAGAAAIPQAALDTLSMRMIPGIGRIFGAAGKKITPEIAKQIAEQSILKTAGVYALQTGKTAGIEGATEAAQQLFERLQAGLNITDKDARDEYFDSFIGGAVLGGALAVPGKFVERGKAKEQAAEAEYAEKQKQEAEAAAAQELEKQKALEAKQVAALVKQQQKTGDLFGESLKAEALPGAAATTTVRERERAAQEAGVEMPTYDEVLRTKTQLEALAKQTQTSLEAAISTGDTKSYREIAPRLESIRLALDATDKQLAALPQPEKAPEIVRAELERDLVKAQNEFKKYTGEAFDKDKLDGVAAKIDDIKAKLSQLAPAGKESGKQADFFTEMAAQDREVLDAQALEQATKLTTPSTKAEPATEEDIAAYRKRNELIQKLQGERASLQMLFDKANSSNDIRSAVDLQKLIDAKDAEIAEAKGQKPTTKVQQAPLLEEIDAVAESKALDKLRLEIKTLDDRLKAAAGSKTALEKDGVLTPTGEKLAAAQVQRDEKVAELARREEALNQYNAQQGAEAATTQAIAQAFPAPESKAGPNVDVIGNIAALRQQVGAGVGLRGQLMGLRRRLQEARAKRNKEGRGVDRQEISRIIAEMRSVTEQIQDQDAVSADLPIPEKLPERTKKYYKALNEVRAKQRKALANYMDALEALANRDYIGGVTKKAKVTKQVLEKRVENAEIAFADSMLEEVAVHRRVTGALPLTEKREDAFRGQYTQALKDVRKLAEGTLAAPESARAVIAEQIADITYAATAERGAKTAFKPLLKTQFASTEQETDADRLAALKKQRERIESFDDAPLGRATDEVAKDIDKEIARMQEKTPDVSNVGVPEQSDLFSPKDLTPIATKRATHKNFMRFVGIQASKFKQSLKEAEAAIAKAKGPVTSLPERIKAYRLRIGEYNKIVREVTASATEEARAAAQAEVKARAASIRKQALAIQDALYNDQIVNLEKSLKTLKSDLRFFKSSVAKMKDSKTQHAANRKIAEIEKDIDSINKQLNSIYESYEAALEDAPIKEENRLFEQYMKADPVLASVKATMERKRATLNKMLEEHDANLEKAASERRLAEPKEEVVEVTPEERAQEQRLLEGLGLPGVKLVEGKLAPVLSAAEKAAAAEEAISAEARRSTLYSKDRAALKKRQEELRAAEAKERKGYEKEINALRDGYEALDPVKDADERLAILKKAEPLFKKYRALTPIERIPADERSKRARGPATKDVTPPQFKTGVKAAPKTRVEAQNKFEAEIAEGLAAERDFDYADTGLSAAAFDDIVADINSAKYRSEDAVSGKGLTGDQAKSFISTVKLPKGLKVIVLNKLNMGLAARIQSQGVNPDTVKGGVLPNGAVFIVANNNANLKDLQKTLAHEVTGHLGVEGVIGEEGMRALAKRVAKQDGGVFALADKLGVGEDALGAYAAAKQMGKSDAEAADVALREVIAHTEEARVDKTFLAKAGEFIKAMVGLVRAGLRKMGIDLDISTSDIYKILRDARKNFNEVVPGIYKGANGDIMFRSKKAEYGPGGDVVATAEGELLYTPKNFEIPKTKAEKKSFLANAALYLEQKLVRGSAGLMQALENKGMKNSLTAVRVKYFIGMYNQKHAWVGTALSKGIPKLIEKTRKDGAKEVILEAAGGANVKDIVEALGTADWGNAEGVRNLWSLHRIKLRADDVGLDKLNFSKDQDITQKLLDDTEAVINRPGNEKLKAAIEKADKIYNQYNRDLMNFLASTGAISKQLAKTLTEKDNFIPYYRKEADGTVKLDLGENQRVTIGNIKAQPYLQQLVGGDERIVDAYTGILQNTNMIMDMALSNLATRNTAYALAETGMLELRPKLKGDMGIRMGKGPASDRVLRFKVQPDPKNAKDTGDRHVVVNTDVAGVPAEFVVEGLSGINTTVPTMFRILGMPAQTLRKFVTVNPAYALRQVVKDPMVGIVANGLDTSTFLKTLKTFGSELTNRDKALSDVERLGIIGSNVFTGTVEDTQKRMLEIANGGPGFMSKLDTLALAADAATRQTAFNNFLKQGLSEMEAVVATYEMMPFTQRGTSRSLYLLSTTIPFLNAQIQGLNVLYKAMRGKATFQEKLRIKQKLFQRASLMAATSMAYALFMQDDDAYKNASDDERYNNWFVYTPLSDQPVKIPTPFEIGILFKALPEAVVNTMSGEKTGAEVSKAMFKLLLGAAPIGPSSIPTAVKSPFEIMMNYSIFGQNNIVSERLKRVAPEERFTDNTTEIAKMIGGVTGKIPVLGEYLSPVQLDYLVRGYTGSTVIAIASMTNPVFRSSAAGEAPESRGFFSSDTPIISGFFQPTDANGIINRAYKDVEKINRAADTYKKLEGDGRTAEAEAYADKQADLLDLAPLAGEFRTRMGELAASEREVRSNPYMSPAEKRKLLEDIKQERILYAKNLISARG